MFALMNPPIKHKRRAKMNSWFGNAAGHAKAAKNGWAKRKKRHGSKLKSARSLLTPGGGRIFSVAANPRPYWPKISRRTKVNSFMGINPYGFNQPLHGGTTMSRKRRGGRRSRFNMGFSSPKSRGLLDAFKPSNLVGVTPILAGVIADGLATKMLSDKIPYTKKGIGSIVLGIGTAGLIGMAGRYASKSLGDGLFVGGIVGTLGCAFQAFMQDGLKSLSLSGSAWSNENFAGMGGSAWSNENFAGMGNFTSPMAVSGAISSSGEGMANSQYSLPNTNAQFQPMLAPPQTPAQHHHAHGTSDHDGAAIGAVLGQNEESYM